MSGEPIIRQAKRSDAAGAGEIGVSARAHMYDVRRELLGAEIFEAAYSDVEDTKRRQLSQLVERAPEKCLVAEVGGEIVGFLCWCVWPNDRVGELLEVTVRKDWHGRGVGSRLCEEGLRVLRERGCSTATVKTGADDGHAAARGLYKKLGFGPTLPWVQYFRSLDGALGND